MRELSRSKLAKFPLFLFENNWTLDKAPNRAQPGAATRARMLSALCSGVRAFSDSTPCCRNSSQKPAGIGCVISATFCRTRSGDLVPGITDATTGCAAQNCRAAAQVHAVPVGDRSQTIARRHLFG